MAVISIKALTVDAIIGIYDHELNQSQPLIFDIDMIADIAAAALTDDIDQALDYATVALRIEAMVKENKKQLLEGLLEDIAATLMREFATISELTLSVRKPQAIANADCAQITLQKTRKH